MSEVVIKQLLPCPTLLPLNRTQPSLMLTSVLLFIVKQQFTQREGVCDTLTLFLLFFFGIVSELSMQFWCSHNRNKQYFHSPGRLNFTRCYLLLPPPRLFSFTGTLWYNFNMNKINFNNKQNMINNSHNDTSTSSVVQVKTLAFITMQIFPIS